MNLGVISLWLIAFDAFNFPCLFGNGGNVFHIYGGRFIAREFSNRNYYCKE